MAEVTFRVPSKAVTYGYIEVPVEVEEGATPETLAAMYVSWVYAFQKEEQATLQRLADGPKEADPRDSIGDPHKAAVEAIKDGLGATEVAVGAVYDHAPDEVVDSLESGDVPWNKGAVASKPKPWETGSAAPKAAPKVTEGW